VDRKIIGKALLFPHIAIMICLVPISVALLVYSMIFCGTASIAAICSYVLAAYTLTVWCFKLPQIIRFFKSFGQKNKILSRLRNDIQFRIKVSLYGTLVWNSAYALLHLGLGIWHRTFWFCSLACYYLSLAVMRFFLVRYARQHRAGEKMRDELVRYRACGIVFLVMNLALALIIFFMVYWNRSFIHHEITTIALAAYTFTAFTASIISIVKYRKYNSPVYSAAKIISFASACVSMLTLESTMLTTFGGSGLDITFRKTMLAVSGAAISAFIIILAVCMIVKSNKKLKKLKTEINYGE